MNYNSNLGFGCDHKRNKLPSLKCSKEEFLLFISLCSQYSFGVYFPCTILQFGQDNAILSNSMSGAFVFCSLLMIHPTSATPRRKHSES
jgi:hypothetical protein